MYFRSIQNQLRLLVATEDQILYIYNIDSNEGGDMTLYKTHRVDGKEGPPRDYPDAADQGIILNV